MSETEGFRGNSLPAYFQTPDTLRTYLETRLDDGVDEVRCLGIDQFLRMREFNMMPPGAAIRVDCSPTPDIVYTVTPDGTLIGQAQPSENMSTQSAPAGVFEPSQILAGKSWAVYISDILSS